MAAFFEELFGLKTKKSQPVQRRDDRVEDGFLIVGDTFMERTTVNPGQRLDRDLPPTYNNAQASSSYHSPGTQPVPSSQSGHYQQSSSHSTAYINYMNTSTKSPSLQSEETLPSYTQAQTMTSWRTELERQQSLEQSVSPGSDAHRVQDSIHLSVIAGVPFKLSPVLESRLSLSDVDRVTMIQRPNMREFEYDFMFEIKILSECGMSDFDMENLNIQCWTDNKKKHGLVHRQFSQEVLPKHSRRNVGNDTDDDMISF